MTSPLEAGAAIAFVPRNGRVVLSVNLEAAQAEGVDLDSELLGLAEVRR